MARKYTKKSEYWESKGKPENNPHEAVRSLDFARKPDLGDEEKHLTEFIVDGKNRNAQDIEKAKELEELLGISVANPFGTVDPDIFEQSLEEKTRSDLQNLCARVGIPPRVTMEETKAALKREFRFYRSKNGASLPGPAREMDINSKEFKDVKRLLQD